MILVCGIMADALIELMCARLNEMQYDYFFLDQRRFPGEFDLTWELCGTGVKGRVSSTEGAVDLEQVTGVYIRYVNYTAEVSEAPAGVLDPREKEMVDAEYQAALMQLIDLLPCRVVNRARASASNDSKVYQGFLANAHGLLSPRTLVTTVPEEALAFYEACGRQVIFKSLSGVRSIVQRLDEKTLARLQYLRNCPTQFQDWIEGVDIRVHTVGDEVFATEIVSEASDYRYAERQGESMSATAITIPSSVASACVAITRALGLEIAGIDLRRTPDGRYYCFEMNPSPGFIFYERSTGQPISEAVARLLRGT